jgi:hypothetical protein
MRSGYAAVSAASVRSTSTLHVAAEPKTAAMPSRISRLRISVRMGMQMTNRKPMQYLAIWGQCYDQCD